MNRREFSHARRGFISKHSARTRTMRAVRCACIVRIVKYLSFAHSWPPPDFPSLEQTAARRMILHRITRWGGEVGSTAGQARVGLHSHRHSPPLPIPLHHHDHHQLLLFLFLSQLTPEVLHSLTKIARGASEVLEIQKMGKFAQVPSL